MGKFGLSLRPRQIKNMHLASVEECQKVINDLNSACRKFDDDIRQGLEEAGEDSGRPNLYQVFHGAKVDTLILMPVRID